MTKPVNVEKATPTILYAKRAPYSSVSNDVVAMINNPDALAIWTYLQTRSSDWKVIGSYLQDRFSIGRERYSKAMASLKGLGLVSHEVMREEGTGKVLGRRVIVHYEPNLQVSECSVNRSVGLPNCGETDNYLIKDFITQSSEEEPTVASAPSQESGSKAEAEKNSPKADELFERFYALYPRKVKKPSALRAWKKQKVTPADFEQIVANLARSVTSLDWKKSGGQYVPHPASWLNDRRWEDEVPAQVGQPSRHTGLDKIDHTAGLELDDNGNYRIAGSAQ